MQLFLKVKESLTPTGAKQNITWHSQSRLFKVVFWDSVSLYDNAGYISKVSKDINCCCQQPHCCLMTPVQWTPTSIHKSTNFILVLQETRVPNLQYSPWYYRSIFIQIFVLKKCRYQLALWTLSYINIITAKLHIKLLSFCRQLQCVCGYHCSF